jgi:hypothetical protein
MGMKKATSSKYKEHTKNTPKKHIKTLNVLTKKDIQGLSNKIDKNQKALDQIDDVARILRENEENLKDLGGLKHRLDTLDRIMVTVDKMAGDMQTYRQEQTINAHTLSKHEDRLEKVEKILHIPSQS